MQLTANRPPFSDILRSKLVENATVPLALSYYSTVRRAFFDDRCV